MAGQISQVDLELKRAFTLMQVSKLETAKKLKTLDLQMELMRNSQRKYVITGKEIADLTPESRVYSSIGRMFALSTVDEIREELKVKEEKCKKFVKHLDEKKGFLMTQLQKQEDSLRDLVQVRKVTA